MGVVSKSGSGAFPEHVRCSPASKRTWYEYVDTSESDPTRTSCSRLTRHGRNVRAFGENERAHDGYSRNGEAANQSEEPKLLAFNFETFAP